jgi:hypothetical protein
MFSHLPAGPAMRVKEDSSIRFEAFLSVGIWEITILNQKDRDRNCFVFTQIYYKYVLGMEFYSFVF